MAAKYEHETVKVQYEEQKLGCRFAKDSHAQKKLNQINKKIKNKKKWKLNGQQYSFKIGNTLIESNDANKLQNALWNNPPPLIIHIIKVLSYCI